MANEISNMDYPEQIQPILFVEVKRTADSGYNVVDVEGSIF
jgi:hypothetical protein